MGAISPAAIVAISILSTVAVLGGIAAAVYFTWPNDIGVDQVRLVGNFTILNRTIADTSDAFICSYMTAILSNEKLAISNCTIIDKSPGSVRVSYSLEIKATSNTDVVLKNASSAIARNSSDTSVFLINQSSITFLDRNGVVQNFCTSKTLCPNVNSSCISVIGGYECVCRVGFIQNAQSCVNATEGRYCNPTKTWIPMAKVCNKFRDCSDDSDEINCTCDNRTDYECLNGRCIYKQRLCDGDKDCPQGDDESPAYCATQHRYCNTTKTWIPKKKVCDKFQDCSDDSDEVNCTCDTRFEYGCLNGRCIYKQWLCNGVNDCPQGDDESPPQCGECSASQFQCDNPRECISSSVQCDGIRNCEDSSDESHCIILGESSVNESGSHLLNATYRGLSGYYVCSDGWNASWSDSVCKQMGYGKAVATSSQVVNGSFLSLDPPQSPASNFMAFLNISNCSSKTAVSVSCSNLECGKRAVMLDNVGPYILNGQRAARGAWPWQVIVYRGIMSSGRFQPVFLCGGSLLNDRWVLTAAHCATIDANQSVYFGYTGTTRPENMQIVLGTISLIDNPDTIKMSVDQVHRHPNYLAAEIDNDVALLRLSQPVTFRETVQPICLPDPDEDLNRFRVCVDTGFGRTLRNTESEDLLQARMNIMPASYCSRNKTQLCIGTFTNTQDINICLGDSGGPLSCQDENGAWIVIGVNSYVRGNGDSSGPSADVCRLSVVARVTAFLDWFSTIMSTNSI